MRKIVTYHEKFVNFKGRPLGTVGAGMLIDSPRKECYLQEPKARGMHEKPGQWYQ